MERDDDVIDLGAVSAETHGLGGVVEEDILKQQSTGLSDDA